MEFCCSGAAHSAALKDNGTLWVWGYNGNDQLGLLNSTDVFVPTQLGTDSWSDVSCGYEFTSGIKSDGTLWSWGFNGNTQLGLGTIPQADEPMQVGADNNWTTIKCGSASNFVLNSLNELYAAGFNQFGTLGDGSGANQSSFIMVTDDVKMVYPSMGGAGTGGVFGHHTFL